MLDVIITSYSSNNDKIKLHKINENSYDTNTYDDAGNQNNKDIEDDSSVEEVILMNLKKNLKITIIFLWMTMDQQDTDCSGFGFVFTNFI